jgi:SAM-dependent MidA family methyltransferase
VSDTPLAEKLRRLIAANGPMSVADYMAHVLGDPEHGYYTTRDPFGAGGDFITAPEVSQMFGEIVGAWLVEMWRLETQRTGGAPAPARLVELGPGRGTLMADILRVGARVRGFVDAVSVHLVETSPALRARQAETLSASKVKPHWHSTFAEVPDGPLFLVANEFFDALPVRQYVRLDCWRERVVGLDRKERLTFGIGPGVLENGPDAPQGSVFEVNASAEAVIAAVAERIVARGGAALAIDYGHTESGPSETLQAVHGHAYADPLAAPGEADLTAHVDFAALAEAARKAGAATHGPLPQGAFLVKLGLLERAGQLGAKADDATRAALQAAVERLAGPDEMGTLFKVLALTRPGVAAPPFAR